ncbi:MAG: T9SS type A sorting domain-containing protein, partial [Bacteroidales bacterium]|nr:T9SS type A sorting domain-containing protein [Bacteroidales bacterium]
MKKQILFLFATLSTLFITLSASAQGEWKWANSWSGGGGQASQFYNKTIKTAFDEDGNIYVLGQIGGHPTFNGQPLQFTEHPLAFNSNNRSTMLAKFDTLGNMLWYKMVKSSESWECYPYWMEVKDNKVYISGDMSLDYVENPATVNDVWLYYFDTLITGSQVHEIPMEQRRPPYKTGRYTCFATFDLDGNLLDHHFVTALDREISTGGVRGEFGLCSPGIGYAPFHVDSKGNIYVITELVYGGLESDPYTIIVDSDTNKIYDVYLPGNVETYGVRLSNAMMYKFSSDWELLYAKPMVNRTEGIATSWEFSLDSVNSHFRLYIYGMSVDEDDNMYVSGQLSLGLFGDYGGDLHQYPVHIYWDSTHYASILDVTSTNLMGVVVKYDTNGTVQWCNQTFTRGDNQFSAYARFAGVCVYDGALVVLGQGKYNDTENGLVFFDDESCPLQRYQQSTSNQTFFIRYDAQSGYYLNQGVFPAQNVICGLFPTVLNNRVFAYAYTIDVNSTNRDKICQWKNDGMFIETIDFTSSGDKNNPSVLANNQGNLLFDIGVTGSVVFSNSVSAGCPSGQSSAAFALYHDPSFAEPYVGITDYEETLSNVRIWPNPTNNILYVESDNVPIDYITIMDLGGRILMKENVGDNSFVMNASCLSAGTYLLETVCKGERSVVKFVKVDD